MASLIGAISQNLLQAPLIGNWSTGLGWGSHSLTQSTTTDDFVIFVKRGEREERGKSDKFVCAKRCDRWRMSASLPLIASHCSKCHRDPTCVLYPPVVVVVVVGAFLRPSKYIHVYGFIRTPLEYSTSFSLFLFVLPKSSLLRVLSLSKVRRFSLLSSGKFESKNEKRKNLPSNPDYHTSLHPSNRRTEEQKSIIRAWPLINPSLSMLLPPPA